MDRLESERDRLESKRFLFRFSGWRRSNIKFSLKTRHKRESNLFIRSDRVKLFLKCRVPLRTVFLLLANSPIFSRRVLKFLKMKARTVWFKKNWLEKWRITVKLFCKDIDILWRLWTKNKQFTLSWPSPIFQYFLVHNFSKNQYSNNRSIVLQGGSF